MTGKHEVIEKSSVLVPRLMNEVASNGSMSKNTPHLKRSRFLYRFDGSPLCTSLIKHISDLKLSYYDDVVLGLVEPNLCYGTSGVLLIDHDDSQDIYPSFDIHVDSGRYSFTAIGVSGAGFYSFSFCNPKNGMVFYIEPLMMGYIIEDAENFDSSKHRDKARLPTKHESHLMYCNFIEQFMPNLHGWNI